MPVVLGLDGKRSGWIACALERGHLLALERHADLAGALGAWQEAARVAVTVPMRHDDPERGVRRCDEEARAALGPHAERVPLVPPLAVFELAADGARERCRMRGWPEPDERSWALRGRIAELARVDDARLVEANAELSFQVLFASLGGTGHLERPAVYWSGLHERLRLLHEVGLRPTRSFGGIGKVEPGDVIGATVAAWTAGRVLGGGARRFPAAGDVALFA